MDLDSDATDSMNKSEKDERDHKNTSSATLESWLSIGKKNIRTSSGSRLARAYAGEDWHMDMRCNHQRWPAGRSIIRLSQRRERRIMYDSITASCHQYIPGVLPAPFILVQEDISVT